MDKICMICPRHCKVDREKRVGFCNEGQDIRITKTIDHFMWEEPCITGERGAFAVFFSGCNLKCSYCQNYEISAGQVGETLSVKEFANLLKEKSLTHDYIDLVTPTHFRDAIIEALKLYKPEIPVVWNSSSYEEDMTQLLGLVDIFLMDFKYANNALGKKYSNCNDYATVAERTILTCAQKTDVFEGDMMKEGLIVRHLILPDEVQNSLEVLDFFAKNLKDRTFSLMSQFTPNGRGEPSRKITPLEYKIVKNHLEALGIEKGYFQSLSSADECYVPNFKGKS